MSACFFIYDSIYGYAAILSIKFLILIRGGALNLIRFMLSGCGQGAYSRYGYGYTEGFNIACKIRTILIEGDCGVIRNTQKVIKTDVLTVWLIVGQVNKA